VRVMRTARRLGFVTIAIHSDVDTDAPHVHAADIAVLIGPAEASQSYLAIERVLDAAIRTGATHVHPGYGFLSENAEFARACVDAGLIFVGPSAEAITLMGDKGRARAAMIAAGVPCVPGYEGDDQSDARLSAEAERIGYPIMIKASSGGGGRGLRIARNAADLASLIPMVRSEASRSFGQGSLVLERALEGVRHVEVQVFGDAHGNVIALGERDCSTQRRHQKVIEEAPSPAVNEVLRARMGEAAVRAAKSANYLGAGTVEMLLDQHGEFYFLEMNTRLQVEHPVTEEVTGLDLVEWQLRVADGAPLPLTQAQVSLHGHAIEARLYAEDPVALMPQTGSIADLHLPACSHGVRIDHALRDGLTVTAHYDPMLGKVIAHGATREEARHRLIAALRELHVLGVVTNKALLLRLLQHTRFARGEVDTGFVDRVFAETEDAAAAEATRDLHLSVACALWFDASARQHAPHPDLRYFRSGGRVPVPMRIELGGGVHTMLVTALRVDAGTGGAALRVDLGHTQQNVRVERLSGPRVRVTCDGLTRDVAFRIEGDAMTLDVGDGAIECFDRSLPDAAKAGGAASGEVTAPMDGVVIRVDVAEGDTVSEGQALVTIESMKLQHVIRAAVSGRVTLVGAQTNAKVKRGTPIVRIVPVD